MNLALESTWNVFQKTALIRRFIDSWYKARQLRTAQSIRAKAEMDLFREPWSDYFRPDASQVTRGYSNLNLRHISFDYYKNSKSNYMKLLNLVSLLVTSHPDSRLISSRKCPISDHSCERTLHLRSHTDKFPVHCSIHIIDGFSDGLRRLDNEVP